MKLSSILLFTLLESCLAQATDRKAKVSVRNNSKQPILDVSVIHKYSDVFKNNQTWPSIQPGEIAKDLTLEVQYRTGFGAIGGDWWAITWVGADQKTSFASKPLNFRNIIDFIEADSPRALSTAASVAAGIAATGLGPVGMVGAAVTTAIATHRVTSYLFNTESTVGFKRHDLTTVDENQLTEIVINDDGTIQFKSKSGESATVSEALAPPPEPEQPIDMTKEDEQLSKAAKAVLDLQKTAPDSKQLEDADEALEQSAKDWLKSWKAKTRTKGQPAKSNDKPNKTPAPKQ
ncbi:hypothetical protein HIM_00678 [Hirsutella minnesotensis 3608]|nr:hypothetical protein HIM_00678 [Hirsutella minnesotensis 3608]